MIKIPTRKEIASSMLDALRYSTVDLTITSSDDPMDIFKEEDEAYMKQIKERGAKHHSKEIICCTKPENHIKKPLFTGFYKSCKICGGDLGDI